MKYLFEDKATDAISRFYQAACSNSICKNLYYSNGNGELFAEAYLLLNAGECVCVFIDMVPDNFEVFTIYRELCELATEEEFLGKLIIMPIFCSEYLMLSYLYRFMPHTCSNPQVVKDCLCVRPWRKSEILQTTTDIKFCKNFEKYCKLVLKKCFIDCVAGKGSFYTDACRCPQAIQECIDMCLFDKSSNFIRMYPCFPRSDSVVGTKLNAQTVINLCTSFCEIYNRAVDLFQADDTRANTHYRKIKPFFEYRSTKSSREDREKKIVKLIKSRKQC